MYWMNIQSPDDQESVANKTNKNKLQNIKYSEENS